MARVTARQAFTRARTKRMRTRAEMNKNLVRQKNNYVQQLSNMGVDVKLPPSTRATVKRQTRNQEDTHKKITDYFASTNKLEFKAMTKKTLRTSSYIDTNGIEIITLEESDLENNNSTIDENDPRNVSGSLPGDFNRSASDSTRTDNSIFGSSLSDLDIKIKIDEDVEIVEMLPPIPLRDHPIHEIDDA